MEDEKKRLLEEIEKLLAFDGREMAINPDYLAYFDTSELLSIRKKLESNLQTMVERNIDWLKSFKKEEE